LNPIARRACEKLKAGMGGQSLVAELEVEIGVGTAAQSAFSSSHWEWALQTCVSVG